MSKSYDVIVIGLGIMGASAAYQVASRSKRVLALDANARGHANGSSHGKTRMARETHGESDDYTPLAKRAYTLWQRLSLQTGRELLRITGGLAIGAPESAHIKGRVASADRYAVPYELIDAREVERRFPAFAIPDDLVAFFDPRAGILAADTCVETYLQEAERGGATLHHSEPVRSWRPDGGGVRVVTSQGDYKAERLIITVGPWAPEFLADLGMPLSVERIVNAHFDVNKPELLSPERCPVYQLAVPEGYYYGFPLLEGQGAKLGAHNEGEICTPQTIRREVTAEEIADLASLFGKYLPGAIGNLKWTLTCMYTNTADGVFVIDLHPEHKEVAYACGFSGRGFKFGSVVGEILADLALTGSTRLPIGSLSAGRFSGAPA